MDQISTELSVKISPLSLEGSATGPIAIGALVLLVMAFFVVVVVLHKRKKN